MKAGKFTALCKAFRGRLEKPTSLAKEDHSNKNKGKGPNDGCGINKEDWREAFPLRIQKAL